MHKTIVLNHGDIPTHRPIRCPTKTVLRLLTPSPEQIFSKCHWSQPGVMLCLVPLVPPEQMLCWSPLVANLRGITVLDPLVSIRQQIQHFFLNDIHGNASNPQDYLTQRPTQIIIKVHTCKLPKTCCKPFSYDSICLP